MTENQISYQVIGIAIELHKYIGPGLLESVYENALCYDLRAAGLGRLPGSNAVRLQRCENGRRIPY